MEAMGDILHRKVTLQIEQTRDGFATSFNHGTGYLHA
jgi:hypothetical protein